MRVKTITYEELRSQPGYNNQRLGVQVELAEDDKPEDAFIKAKQFISAAFNGSFEEPYKQNPF